MSNGYVLVIDDDEAFCRVLSRSLVRKGFDVTTAVGLATTEVALEAQRFEYAIVDLCIGEESGLTIVKKIKLDSPETQIIMLTGYASIATAVEAIKLGAMHYLTKPAEIEDIIAAFGKEEGDDKVKLAESPLSVKRLEWEHIQKVLHEHDGNISAAARAMDMHRRTLQRKLQKKPVQQ